MNVTECSASHSTVTAFKTCRISTREEHAAGIDVAKNMYRIFSRIFKEIDHLM
jgi:hypothetical protein